MASPHRTRAALLLALGVAASIGVAAWFTRERANPAARKEPAAQAVPAAATPAAAPAPRDTAVKRGAAPKASNDAPLPEGSIGDTYATLVRLADDGNGAAALRLANLMLLCAKYVPKSREAAEQDIVEGMARFEAPRNEAEAREQDELVGAVVEIQERQHAACPGFDTLGIADPLAEQRRWTQVAAGLGEARAIVELADSIIRKYTARGDIVEHAEELRALRPQAMALLQQAVAMGEPAALLRMSAAHRTGDLAPVDAVEAHAWMLAYRAGPPLPDVPQIAIERVARRLEDPLDAAQRAEAQRRADAIRARCCGGG